MIAEYGLRDALIGNSGVVAVVVDRVYPMDTVPQAPTTPYITYQRISSVSELTLDHDEDPGRVRIQLNCVATTATGARALATIVKAVFFGGFAATGIQLAKIDGDGALPKDPESKLFGVHVDVVMTLSAAEAA